jgi:hypothetical protein
MEPSPPQDHEAVVEQSSEAAAGGPPAEAGLPGKPQGPQARRKRLRQVQAVGLSIVALLCLGGSAAAFLFYGQVTKPDLRTPVLVTHEFLSAYLVDHDDVKAAQFQCVDGSDLRDVRAFRDDIDARQKKFAITFTVSVDSVRETTREDSIATVTADIAISAVIQGQSRRDLEHWVFNTHNDKGWRVCSGHEVT